jgi:hypothetical protein
MPASIPTRCSNRSSYFIHEKALIFFSVFSLTFYFLPLNFKEAPSEYSDYSDYSDYSEYFLGAISHSPAPSPSLLPPPLRVKLAVSVMAAFTATLREALVSPSFVYANKEQAMDAMRKVFSGFC